MPGRRPSRGKLRILARAVTDLVVPSDSIRAALLAGRPVVALETSVLAQGLPAPRNLEAGRAMVEAVQTAGAEPAWVWVREGRVCLGASTTDLEALAEGSDVAKVARRDLPMAIASGRLGATTVSATLWAARRAGIEVMATGGIGGVHPGTGDVSADLSELGRTAGTLVCSGPKSIVDPRATLERLEELGVGMIGYRCERLPFFLVPETDLGLEHRAEDPIQVATAIRSRRRLGIQSALLVCNPIPASHAMEAERVSVAMTECLARAERMGVSGKWVTPFLLSCLAERTQGASLEANLALLAANAALAGQIAVAVADQPRA
jgi:pseudouridylate synthase